MPYTVRATYTDLTPQGEDEDYLEESGWVDPTNPYGGFTSEDEPMNHILDTLAELVHFIVDFPGGVWDFSEGEYHTEDYRTGRERQVTLHVADKDQERAFKWAAIVQRIEDARRRHLYN